MAVLNLFKKLFFASPQATPKLSLVDFRRKRFYFATFGLHNSEFFVPLHKLAQRTTLLLQLAPADAFFIGSVFGELYASGNHNNAQLEFPNIDPDAIGHQTPSAYYDCHYSGVDLRHGILLYNVHNSGQHSLALDQLKNNFDLIAKFHTAHAYQIGFVAADWLVRHERRRLREEAHYRETIVNHMDNIVRFAQQTPHE